MNPVSCSMAAMAPRATAARGDEPATRMLPRSAVTSPTIIPMVVLLPAPFGPSNATDSPRAKSRSSERIA